MQVSTFWTIHSNFVLNGGK